MDEKFKQAYGLTPACMTIWNEDQTYNKKGMEQYLGWLLDNGAQSLSICGSTGENIAMNMEEQREIIDHVLGFVAGQVPVVVGTGRYATLHTVDMSKYAQSRGADGVMVILPYYLAPYKEAVMNAFRELRSETDLHIMIYNNPHFAGYEMTVPEIKQLVEEGVIDAIKAAHGDPNRVHELKFHCGDNLKVFYGHDYCAMEGLLAGADGWLSGFLLREGRRCGNSGAEQSAALHRLLLQRQGQRQTPLAGDLQVHAALPGHRCRKTSPSAGRTRRRKQEKGRETSGKHGINRRYCSEESKNEKSARRYRKRARDPAQFL